MQPLQEEEEYFLRYLNEDLFYVYSSQRGDGEVRGADLNIRLY